MGSGVQRAAPIGLLAQQTVVGLGEVENCLMMHPAAAMAAVVGEPDPDRTELVEALVARLPASCPTRH